MAFLGLLKHFKCALRYGAELLSLRKDQKLCRGSINMLVWVCKNIARMHDFTLATP